MGGRAFSGWERIPQAFLEEARLRVPRKRRPSFACLELVGRVVVQNMPEHSNTRLFGECDETHQQIADRLHGLLKVEQVAAALHALDGHIFVITRRAAKGRNGTHRTFHPELGLKIATWELGGMPPTPTEVALWDDYLFSLGYRPRQSGIQTQDSGTSPVVPIEVPIANTYITPTHEAAKESGPQLFGSSRRKLTPGEIDRLKEISRQTWRKGKTRSTELLTQSKPVDS